ncbi:MAG: shikimate dehydrogenase [Chlamydiales bacterium]
MALALILSHPSEKDDYSKVDLYELYCDKVALRPKSGKNFIFTKPTKSDLALKPAFVDLDWQSELFPEVHCKTKVISSYHNYEETPDLEKQLAQMQKRPADFYKLATHANSSLDALRMIRFRRKHSNVIGICMGEKGFLTRVTAPICGQHHTYASTDNNSLGIPKLEELLTTYNYRKLSRKTKLFALIGNPLHLSPSHITHNQTFREKKWDALYVKVPINKEELPAFIPYMDLFAGFSVTHPLKEAIIPYLKNIDQEAKEIGAVNTVINGCGFNSDGKGAWNAIGNLSGKRVAILGRGGAARAAAYEAKKRGYEPKFYHRTTNLAPYDILINATPLGMKGELALPRDKILEGTTVLDMVIGETLLLKAARQKKCRVIYGIEMFQKQASHQLSLLISPFCDQVF